MKLTLEIENTEDAIIAKRVIEAYTIEGSTETNIKISQAAAKVIEDPKDGGPHMDGEEPKEEKVAEKSKRKPRKKIEKAKEEPKEETTEEPKDEAVEEDETETTESEMDLKTLTAIAKDAVANSDRATVKSIISKYGEKLSAVDEADYAKLAEELKDL